MIGPVLIWYAAGVAIGAVAILDAVARRRSPVKRPGGAEPTSRLGMVWLALAVGGLIFAVWPWVALSLARNATL